MTTKQLPSDITTLNSNNVNYNSINFIYKRTSTGVVQVWAQEVVLHQYRSVIGQIDGKLQVSDWTTAKPKNIGKSNQRSGTQQAFYEVAANYTKKLKEGYFEFIEDIDNQTYIKAMLAYDYKDYKDKIAKEEPQLIFVSSKLDGGRCIATKDGLFSRWGEEIKSCDHINEALIPFFKIHPDAILDGELYNHSDISFNDIMSIFKRTYSIDESLNFKYDRKQPKANKLIDKLDSSLLSYYVFDSISNDLFEHRYNQLINWFVNFLWDSSVIQLVKQTQCKSDDLNLIDSLYKTYLAEGYEGQMIKFNTSYVNKRSKYLLKRKEWMDSEYTLVDILEGNGNWKGKARIAVFDGFNADIVGTYDECSNWLKNKDNYIGKLTTIKYFELTEDGAPRFGKVKELDRKI